MKKNLSLMIFFLFSILYTAFIFVLNLSIQTGNFSLMFFLKQFCGALFYTLPMGILIGMSTHFLLACNYVNKKSLALVMSTFFAVFLIILSVVLAYIFSPDLSILHKNKLLSVDELDYLKIFLRRPFFLQELLLDFGFFLTIINVSFANSLGSYLLIVLAFIVMLYACLQLTVMIKTRSLQFVFFLSYVWGFMFVYRQIHESNSLRNVFGTYSKTNPSTILQILLLVGFTLLSLMVIGIIKLQSKKRANKSSARFSKHSQY